MDHNNDKYAPDAQPLTKEDMFYLSGKAKEFMEKYDDTYDHIVFKDRDIKSTISHHSKNERP
jgi:hypothetical protein